MKAFWQLIGLWVQMCRDHCRSVMLRFWAGISLITITEPPKTNTNWAVLMVSYVCLILSCSVIKSGLYLISVNFILTSFLFWSGGFCSLIEDKILKEVPSLLAGGDWGMKDLSIFNPKQLLHLRTGRWERVLWQEQMCMLVILGSRKFRQFKCSFHYKSKMSRLSVLTIVFVAICSVPYLHTQVVIT